MKLRTAIIAAAATLLAGCAAPEPTPTIYVSIAPLKFLTEAIVGNDFPVEVLVPAGAGPETFEPTPRQMSALHRAQLVVGTGLIDFEQNLLRDLSERGEVVDLSRGIALVAGSCSHTHGTTHAHGVDPHIWTSPKALKIMASNLYEALHRIHPDSARYTTAYLALRDSLDALDLETARTLRAARVRAFAVYHPALTYYARDYGLEQIAIEHEGKEPSARHLASVIDRMRRDSIRRILYQAQYPVSTVEAVAGDAGARPTPFDPLDEQVTDNIRRITRMLADHE